MDISTFEEHNRGLVNANNKYGDLNMNRKVPQTPPPNKIKTVPVDQGKRNAGYNGPPTGQGKPVPPPPPPPKKR